jgi:O-antigen/teichoic acid export membrane protein
MSPESIQSFLALAIGFAVAGLLSSAYQLVAQQPASFRLLAHDSRPAAFASVPFLVFAAPFIIMRNTLRARMMERRRFEFVMLATVLAGFWALMSGSFVVMLLTACRDLIG